MVDVQKVMILVVCIKTYAHEPGKQLTNVYELKSLFLCVTPGYVCLAWFPCFSPDFRVSRLVSVCLARFPCVSTGSVCLACFRVSRLVALCLAWYWTFIVITFGSKSFSSKKMFQTKQPRVDQCNCICEIEQQRIANDFTKR